jgi:hypothetical protein
MALGFATRKARQKWSGQGKVNACTDVTLDASYVNGTGYTITNTQLGLPPKAFIDFVDIQPPHSGFYYTIAIAADGQSITLRAWTTGSAAGNALQEAATNLAGLNGVVVRLLAVGN